MTKFDISKISCPATVQSLDPMAVKLSLYSPVSLASANISNVHALLVQNVANPSAGSSFELHSVAALNLPANSWVDVDIEDDIPDVEGTYYLLGAAMDYTQPVTNTIYQLFFALDTPPAVDVEADNTGSITINIE